MKPSILTRRAFGAALSLTLLTGLIARAGAQDTYSWSFVQKVGDVQRFRTYVRITARQADNSGDIVITTRSESRHDIKAVAEDGTITYEQIDEKAEAILNGAPLPPPTMPPKPITITLAKNGVMLKRVNPSADPFDRSQKSLPALMAMPAPAQPVAMGGSWKTDIPNPLMKGKTITITSTLAAKETVLGKEALRVNVEMTFPSAFGADENETLVVKGSYWLDVTDYSLLKMDYKVKNPVLPFPAAKIESQSLVHRRIPGVNDKEDADGEKLFFQKKAENP